MIKTFITRDLSENSPFYALRKNGLTIFNQSLIEFRPLPFKLKGQYEWLFFYSKNGVKFFFENGDSNSIKFSQQAKIACMGYGTAETFTHFSGAAAQFIGKGNPSQVASQFQTKIDATKDKIAFITAQFSLHSVGKKILSKKIDQYKVYDNYPKKDIHIPQVDIVLTTSPKNAKLFLQNYKYDNDLTYLSIGKTTASSLHQLGVKKIIIAPRASEISMARVLSIILS